jgi:hypothetical protein
MPIARVLVQIVYTKDCNKPGYNLLPLRDLLIKFYGYPTERWDVDEFFKELYHEYLSRIINRFVLVVLIMFLLQENQSDHRNLHYCCIVKIVPKNGFMKRLKST